MNLVERSRRHGGRLRRRGAGDYVVGGTSPEAEVMALEVVREDVVRWCKAVTADE